MMGRNMRSWITPRIALVATYGELELGKAEPAQCGQAVQRRERLVPMEQAPQVAGGAQRRGDGQSVDLDDVIRREAAFTAVGEVVAQA